ncbi:hypothetical protein LTR94_035911, partial [Friedmanniomyces endolithicus]
MEADGVGSRDLAHLLLAARRGEQPFLGAKLVQALIQIQPALMVQAEQLGPAVVFQVQPDRAVPLAVVGVDVDRRADQARPQQLALPAAQRIVQRAFAQGQGRMAR